MSDAISAVSAVSSVYDQTGQGMTTSELYTQLMWNSAIQAGNEMNQTNAQSDQENDEINAATFGDVPSQM